MPALPSPRDLRRHLLLIHSVEMHLISIKVLIEMYFILIEILKNVHSFSSHFILNRISKNLGKGQSTCLLLRALQRRRVESLVLGGAFIIASTPCSCVGIGDQHSGIVRLLHCSSIEVV